MRKCNRLLLITITDNEYPKSALIWYLESLFSESNEEFVGKCIGKINVKMANGIGGISPKLLHFAKPVIILPIVRQPISPTTH
jgi:hypothetical protein